MLPNLALAWLLAGVLAAGIYYAYSQTLLQLVVVQAIAGALFSAAAIIYITILVAILVQL